MTYSTSAYSRPFVLSTTALAVTLAVMGCDNGPPPPPPPPPEELVTTGTYALESRFDLTVAAVIPDPVGSYLPALRGLRDDPADTIFLLLDEAGVPLAQDLLGVLPSAISNRVKGWIDEYVASAVFEGTPVGTELDRLIDEIERVLTTFDVASAMTIADRDATGRTAAATHRLETLRWALYGGAIRISVPIVDPAPVPAGLLTREAMILAAFSTGSDADAIVHFRGHDFGLAYGTYALQALEQAMQARYGTDLRGALGRVIGCPALAASVANRCVLSLCVGHQAELEAICGAALDLAAEDVRDRIRALSFDVMRLESGIADAWDAPQDGGPTDSRVDRLADGSWAAQIDIGMGLRRMPATFTGTRRE